LPSAESGAVALTGRAVGLDHDVAELGPRPGRAAEDLTAEDQPPTDPGADRQHHRRRFAARRPIAVLGQGSDVAVVVEEDRQADRLGDQVADRQVDQRQIDRGDRFAALLVDRRRDAEPDRGGVRAGVARRLHLADQQLDHLVLGLAVGSLPALPQSLDTGQDADLRLRPAEVDPDRLGLAHPG
jgi:hypothetical protein